eukprot:gnl/TRDRNA2_/TRDRNA2_177608_c3_seq22.p1 gnl/TRDRNA2_/TRDRNA2_177608_c3~~gnl/TRDRNA2_/TRDRNA2_177608_c3_seq22.p1  ORF type:complete len:286 (+),score=36.41 gnl/TRDRNA2_/TRDRNA2_177608_c3_seq22:198-1055(+)
MRRQDHYRCSQGCYFDICLDCYDANFRIDAAVTSSPASVPQIIGRGRCSKNGRGRCSKNLGAWGSLLAAAEQLESIEAGGSDRSPDARSSRATDHPASKVPRDSLFGEVGNRRSGFNDITALHEAAMNGDLSKVSECLDQGEVVNVRTDAGNTPLGFAVVHGHEHVTRYLLNARSDVNNADHLGVTPLHSAAEQGYADIAKALLAAGARVNAVDVQLKTPLHEAARMGHMPLALVLLPAGADVNAKSDAGYTPLAMAEDWGTVEMADFLKSRGAGRYVDRYGPAQ